MTKATFLSVLATCALAFAGHAAELPKGKIAGAARTAINPGEATREAELAAKKFKLAPGLKVDLWAAEPNLANPVAFCIDERGRIYVSETHRLHQGVTDIRGHMNWLDEELAAKSTDDMRQLFIRHKYDGKTNVSERVTLIEDRTGSGLATHYSTFADGIFNSTVDGIASGVLARRGNVWFANIPNLWLLRDNDGDGQTDGAKDLRKAVFTGFGVRVGFLGHDLHGLTIGPDGKLYFSIGDRGANVKSLEGKTVANTEMGAIYRCNQDGSDLEIFHFGLRNPQELAFDEFGNLFTGDNNSDGGDPARWVYAVEGGDTGWRIGWQFIESAPWTTRRGPWLGERMCFPEDRAAHILPPIVNIANGPSGLAYYPGTGLPEKYDRHFLLADFKGASAASGIWSFKMQPKGASFDLVEKEQFLWNALATDVDFGYDGHVYFSDWIEGWAMTGKGRLYRISDPSTVKNADEVKALFAAGFPQRSVAELKGLLAHRDMRVRQEAQFTLVEKKAVSTLIEVAAKSEAQRPRLHAIWGLGQLLQQRNLAAGDRTQIRAALQPLLAQTADDEITAQAAKVLGEARDKASGGNLIPLLSAQNPRVRHLAAIALGKIREPNAVPALVKLLEDNADKDAVLRHSGVMGLLGCADVKAIAALKTHASPSVRIAAVVALRRLERPEVGQFLNDANGRVMLEAARAISEIPIPQALPALAALQPDFGKLTAEQRPALARRILSANYRLGDAVSAGRLAGFAGNADLPEAARAEALDLLAEWAKPSGRDRITGLWRPLPARDAKVAGSAAKPVLTAALRTGATPVRLAAVKAASQLDIADANPALAELVADTKADTKVRVDALNRLAAAKDAGLETALTTAAQDKAEPLRVAATTIRAKSAKGGSAVAPLRAILASGTTGEKQNAIVTLGGIAGKEADAVIAALVTDLAAGKLAPELLLEVLEAADKRTDAAVTAALDKFKAQRKPDDLLWSWRIALAGGNAANGKKIFLEKVEASCARCHKVGPDGGEVGPVLDGIASRQTREYLLRSLVAPNAEIAPGFESLIVVLKDGRNFAGVARPGGPDEVVINSPEDGVMKFKKADVAKIQKGQSAMPDTMILVLSKRDIRDLVEFLASLK